MDTTETIAAALLGMIERQRKLIEDQSNLLYILLGRVRGGTTPSSQLINGAKTQTTAAAAPKPKRRLSAAGRRRIAEATRKRWAKIHAERAAAAAQANKKAASPKRKAAKKVA